MVETDQSCEVEILDSKANTFTVEGHHFALVSISGLKPGWSHQYEVHLDGRVNGLQRVRISASSAPSIPADGNLRMLFGSCRTSAPHRPPHTFQRWWHRRCGIDALHTFALRMLRQPQALCERSRMLGRPSLCRPTAEECPRDRRPPQGSRGCTGRILKTSRSTRSDIAISGTYPVVRWMLSMLPSSMIFDDHEISNEWNTSQTWLDEKRQTDWYEGRVVGGLMADWIYQHLGNLLLRAEAGRGLRAPAERRGRKQGGARTGRARRTAGRSFQI